MIIALDTLDLPKDDMLDKALYLLQKMPSRSQPLQTIMHGLKQLQKAPRINISKLNQQMQQLLKVAWWEGSFSPEQRGKPLKEALNEKTHDKRAYPLVYRAAAGRKLEDLVQVLVETPYVDIEARSSTGSAALHGAVSNGRVKSAELLLFAKANVNAKRSDGKTPLDLAFEHENHEFIDLLKMHGGKQGSEL